MVLWGALLTAQVQSFEVIPAVVDVEAGGSASQVLVRGPGAEKLTSLNVIANGRPVSYLLARYAGKGAGQITVVLQARKDSPRNLKYTLTANGRELPLKIRIVSPGEAKQTGIPVASARDVREVVREAQTSQVVISADQAPQVTRTLPEPLMIAPDGEGKTLQLWGKRLDTIDDVRVRRADQPPRYRGKQGQLPFRHQNGMLEVEVMATRNTPVGERYVLDLMVGKFKAVSVGFEIGHPQINYSIPDESAQQGLPVIRLPESASQPADEE